MGWISPTGHNDPGTAWTFPERAYDEFTSQAAFTTDKVPAGNWSSFLELTHAALNCSKIRFWIKYEYGFGQVDFDVEYESDPGNWHDVYQGTDVNNKAWTEKDIPEGTQSITKVRFRQYVPVANKPLLYEFDFWEIPVVAPTVTTQSPSNVSTDSATSNQNITDNGGENCDKRGACWNIGGNPTVADDKSEETDSFGTGAFTRPMTGLTPGQHYYVRGYAHNSAGYGYGNVVEFTTKEIITGAASGEGIGIAQSTALNIVLAQSLASGIGLATSSALLKAFAQASASGMGLATSEAKLNVLAQVQGSGVGESAVQAILDVLAEAAGSGRGRGQAQMFLVILICLIPRLYSRDLTVEMRRPEIITTWMEQPDENIVLKLKTRRG